MWVAQSGAAQRWCETLSPPAHQCCFSAGKNSGEGGGAGSGMVQLRHLVSAVPREVRKAVTGAAQRRCKTLSPPMHQCCLWAGEVGARRARRWARGGGGAGCSGMVLLSPPSEHQCCSCEVMEPGACALRGLPCWICSLGQRRNASARPCQLWCISAGEEGTGWSQPVY